ncbi:hypothetical protein [Roseateles amylovorans]|uniref:Uncharacterized protein n=1 Tax=Roseateles amylovorans TaxID=2978473 RepID=A0ABY6B3Z6_9BURK|nr:hypothetical protein [Roseateles amylovorans]UXH80098.1 hypothetical protein N4261_09535 [Roseateles amylovorans]
MVRSLSEEQLGALVPLLQLVLMEGVADVLGVIDPMSGNEECGDLEVRDVRTGDQLEFLQGAFLRECAARGFD